MHTPRSLLKGTLLPLLVGAFLMGCGSKDETGPKKVDVAAQVAQLKGNSDAKANALTELAAGGPNSAAAVNDILPLLKDEDHVVRRLGVGLRDGQRAEGGAADGERRGRGGGPAVFLEPREQILAGLLGVNVPA